VNFITDAFPASLYELGYLYAGQEHRPWYLVQRGEEIGITAELEPDDEVISVYESE
jgi:hypothetical protein